jgi:hypothetical protein
MKDCDQCQLAGMVKAQQEVEIAEQLAAYEHLDR